MEDKNNKEVLNNPKVENEPKGHNNDDNGAVTGVNSEIKELINAIKEQNQVIKTQWEESKGIRYIKQEVEETKENKLTNVDHVNKIYNDFMERVRTLKRPETKIYEQIIYTLKRRNIPDEEIARVIEKDIII